MAVNTYIRRAAIPAAVVAGVAAAAAGVWPALASDGGPELPETTAEELIVRIAESDQAQMSGTVRVETGLAVPAGMDGMLGDLAGEFGAPAGRLVDLATGQSTLEIATDGPERQRLSVGEGKEELSVIHNDGELWTYDAASNTVLHAGMPEMSDASGASGEDETSAHPLDSMTPQEAAERLLEEAGQYADVTVEGTSQVAGRSAYQLLIEPTEPVEPPEGRDPYTDGPGGVEWARIAVDSETGVPLAVTVQGQAAPLLDISFSRIDFGRPAGGTFDFTPPQGAEVIQIDPGAPLGGLLSGSPETFLPHFD